MPPHAPAPPVVPRDDRYAPPSDAACEVLGRALDVIIADPDGWDQDVYGRREACGTAFCLAGHVAVTVLGYRPVWSGGRDASLLSVVTSSGRRTPPDHAAAHALELLTTDPELNVGWYPDARAERLFAAARSLRRLLDLAFLYTQGRVDRFAAYDRLAGTHPWLVDRDAQLDAEDGGHAAARWRSRQRTAEANGERTRPTSDRVYWERELS